MNKQILPLSQNKSKKFASTWAIHNLRTNTVDKSIKLTMIANRSMIVKLPMIIRVAHNTLTLNSTFKAFLVNWLSKKQNSIKYWRSWIMLLVLKNENLTQNKRKKMKWCRELICWDCNQFETTLAKWLSRELKKARNLKDSQLTWILRLLKIKEIWKQKKKTIKKIFIFINLKQPNGYIDLNFQSILKRIQKCRQSRTLSWAHLSTPQRRSFMKIITLFPMVRLNMESTTSLIWKLKKL